MQVPFLEINSKAIRATEHGICHTHLPCGSLPRSAPSHLNPPPDAPGEDETQLPNSSPHGTNHNQQAADRERNQRDAIRASRCLAIPETPSLLCTPGGRRGRRTRHQCHGTQQAWERAEATHGDKEPGGRESD